MKSFIIILFSFIFNSVIFAAPPPPPASAPGCWPPPCIPIDGGIVFLIVAGSLYGAKKIIDYRKQQQTTS